jgi:Tol biopolymer transport system component
MALQPRVLSILPLLLLALPVSSRAQEFSLADVMSAPMPSGLVVAPGGDALAWVQNEEGVRNVFVAVAPDFRGRALTGFTEDDGQELGGLQFTMDGSSLIFVRGGGPNRSGEFPNPRSFTDGVDRASFIVPLAGGEPVRLRDGGGLTLSPDGETAVYSSRGAVHRIRLVTPATGESDPPEPEQLFEARGGIGSLTFSPDGSRLAFVSRRGDHSFVGVWAEGDEAVTWMGPGV